MQRQSQEQVKISTADVFIHSAVSTKITNRPKKGFYELCLEAGRGALRDLDPLKIDSMYIASMEPAGFSGVTGELVAVIAEELGIMPREALAIRGTSSAGGIGCIPCFKDIASGMHRYSLLISCEQMNWVVDDSPMSLETRRQERDVIQRLLGGVIDADDRSYGLSMVLIGDMFERALNHYLGLSRRTARNAIADLTMAMYRRAREYPFAQFFGNNRSIEAYEQSPWISPNYRRDDVVPVSSGACAIVFSSNPPESDRVVKLRGIGQGIQHPSLMKRFGPVTSSPSIRRAVYSMLRRSNITLGQLRESALGFPHDAFPSISRIICKEIGLGHEEIMRALISGRFNPCGGLSKCGHPVGCSGELQLVRAFQAMSHDKKAFPESIRPARADTAFTVSVGAALTNIVAVCLEARERGGTFPKQVPPDAGYFDKTRRLYLEHDGLYQRYEDAMRGLARGVGVVLTGTVTPLGHVSLLQTRTRKLMVVSEEEKPIGALVEVIEEAQAEGGLNQVGVILEERLEERLLQAFGIIPPEIIEGDIRRPA